MSEYTTAIGIIAGILTSAATIPQLIKVIKEKDVENLSPFMIMILCCGVGLWTLFGTLKNEWPIILSNGFSFVVNSIFLSYYYLYKEN